MMIPIICCLYTLSIFGSAYYCKEYHPEDESKTPESIFAYQTKEANIQWTETSRHLWDWLMAQKSKNVITFCPSDSKIDTECNLVESDNVGRPIRPINLPKEGTFVSFQVSTLYAE